MSSVESATIEQTILFPTTPATIYADFLSSEGHTKMTGAAAEASAVVGESFSCWTGYLVGKNEELVENEKIVQSWRSTNWPEGHYSTLNIFLEATGESGCTLKMVHEKVPVTDVNGVSGGWWSHYWEPMQKLYSSIELSDAKTTVVLDCSIDELEKFFSDDAMHSEITGLPCSGLTKNVNDTFSVLDGAFTGQKFYHFEPKCGDDGLRSIKIGWCWNPKDKQSEWSTVWIELKSLENGGTNVTVEEKCLTGNQQVDWQTQYFDALAAFFSTQDSKRDLDEMKAGEEEEEEANKKQKSEE